LFGADVQFAHASTSSTFATDKSTITYDQFSANLKTTWRPQSVRWLNPFALSGMGMTRSDSRNVSPETIFYIDHKNMFALRLGGGAEIIPHPRIAFRLDVSDLTSRVPERTNCIKCDLPAYWWNQLDASISVMVRIGANH
jgi:opacity protein-like surface antigen